MTTPGTMANIMMKTTSAYSLKPQRYTIPGRPKSLDQLRVMILSDAAVHRNGVGSYYRDLCGNLKSNLADITLLSPTRRSAGMYLFSLPLPGDATQSLRIPNAPRIAGLVRQRKPDVLIAATPGPFGLYALHCSRRFHIPLVTGLHTDYSELARLYWQNRAWRSIVQRYFRQINRNMLQASTIVAGVNPALCRMAHGFGAKKTVAVGSPLSRMYLESPTAPRGRIRNILFAGRLAREKNLPAIIEAAARLPDITFHIAGDGPLRDSVHKASHALPNIRPMGWLSRAGLRDAMDACDLLILPSISETFGSVALEAAARQRPVLVSAACGIRDWPAFENAIHVIPQNGHPADAIRELTQLPPAAIMRSGYAAGQAARRFHEACLRQWEQILLDACTLPVPDHAA